MVVRLRPNKPTTRRLYHRIQLYTRSFKRLLSTWLVCEGWWLRGVDPLVEETWDMDVHIVQHTDQAQSLRCISCNYWHNTFVATCCSPRPQPPLPTTPSPTKLSTTNNPRTCSNKKNCNGLWNKTQESPHICSCIRTKPIDFKHSSKRACSLLRKLEAA